VTLATDRLDVVAIGNAVVDVIARVGDPFLAEHGVDKGVMTLIDRDRAEALYAAMPPAREISGGSAANTAARLAALGCKTGFLGRVRDDQLGRIFMHDIRATGVRYDGPVVSDGPETSRCLVLVSPDGERSMSTYLGASTGLVADDIDTDVLRRADWLYLEGYLFDTPEAKAAYAGAIRAAKPGAGRISITLSDPLCVNRHREDFRRLLRNEVDLLFANRAELLSLCEATDLETALDVDVRYLPHRVNTGEGEHEISDEDLSIAFYRDDEIDLGGLVREQLHLAAPMKPLCDEQCRGLCPSCGVNRNGEACGCDTGWRDPRFDALRTFARPAGAGPRRKG